MDGSPTIKTAETRERFTSGDWSLEVIPEGHQITAGPHVFVGLLQLASDDDARLMASAPELFSSLNEVSDMLMARPDIVKALQPLMGFAEKAIFDRAAAALARARGEPTPDDGSAA